jgi:hypothetical protein
MPRTVGGLLVCYPGVICLVALLSSQSFSCGDCLPSQPYCMDNCKYFLCRDLTVIWGGVMSHLYLSTACLHGEHGQCRLVASFVIRVSV